MTDSELRNIALIQRINISVNIIHQYGLIDGDHHKMWVLDQVARELLKDEYEKWADSDWDVGIAP